MPADSSRINRRDFLAGCAAAAATLTAACEQEQTGAPPSPAGEDRKPNIIFILADDLGYGDLGCYGQEMIGTPNIDRLAGEGMRFTDHYAGSTVCAPSRCCLMTGFHTGHAYIRGNREVRPMGQEPIPDSQVTVAEVLRRAGYTTGLIGKWGLGPPGSEGTPNNQGFDYFFGYLCQRHAHNYYPEFLFRNGQRVVLDNVVDNERGDGAGEAVSKEEYSHDLFMEEALSFVGRNREKPFFLYLAATIPHANNEAGNEGMEVPSDEPYSDRDWPQQQKNHAAMITRLDSGVGRLMARLKELGLDENTLVIFSSDNGPHREGGADPAFFDSNGPLRGIKRDLYEGGIRVPMIARWPGRIPAGSLSSHASAFWDFLPTAAEVAGAEAPAGIDGISYLPALTGERQPEHDYLYWEFHGGGGPKQAVRKGEWKAVRPGPEAPTELYNLTEDVGETSDLADQKPELVGQMEEIMRAAHTESGIWKLGGEE